MRRNIPMITRGAFGRNDLVNNYSSMNRVQPPINDLGSLMSGGVLTGGGIINGSSVGGFAAGAAVGAVAASVMQNGGLNGSNNIDFPNVNSNNQPQINYQNNGYNNQQQGNYQNNGYNNQPQGNYQNNGYNNQPQGNYLTSGYSNQPQQGNYQNNSYNNQQQGNYQNNGYNNQPQQGNYQNNSYNNQQQGNYQNNGYNNQPQQGNYQNNGYNNQPQQGNYQNNGYNNQPQQGNYPNNGYNNQPQQGNYQNNGYNNNQPQANYQNNGYNNQPQQTRQTIKRNRVQSAGDKLMKGQKYSIKDKSGTLVSDLKICLGWDIKDSRCELDASAFMLTDSGKVPGDEWFVFYGQPDSPDGAVHYKVFKDDPSSPDDAAIELDLYRVDLRVQRIALAVTIYEAARNALNFGMVQNLYARIVDSRTGQEIAGFTLDECSSAVTAMVLGELYRYKGEWKFNAVGSGVNKELAEFCGMYGVELE